MSFRAYLTLLAATVTAACIAGATPDTAGLEARKKVWQADFDASEFRFDDTETGLAYCLSQYKGDADLAIVYSPNLSNKLRFELRFKGKVVASLDGGTESCFLATPDTFYFAKYRMGVCGCTIVAVDTHLGATRWETKLIAAGNVSHSLYFNKVLLETADVTPNVASGHVKSIFIEGQEDAGSYKEALDAATGERLAHRLYEEKPPNG